MKITTREGMRALILALTLVATGVTGEARQAGVSSMTTVDVGTLALREVWDFNGSTESLVGAVVGVDHGVWRGLAVRAEVLALRVVQDRDDAWLRGVAVGTRMRWRSHRTRPLVDMAVGLSHATSPVPPTGTRVNYLAVLGGGVERRLHSVVLTVTGRWVHASNNGREGRHRNPDTQSFGALLSVGWEH